MMYKVESSLCRTISKIHKPLNVPNSVELRNKVQNVDFIYSNNRII